MTERPEGFHEHHRQLRRGGDDSPVNLLYIGPELHNWIHANPAEAQKLGLIVSQYENPGDVVITIPDRLVKKSAAKKSDAPRKRSTVSVRVPKDVLEDGEEVLTTLIDAARERLAPHLNFQGDVPAYFVLTAVLHDWLTT